MPYNFFEKVLGHLSNEDLEIGDFKIIDNLCYFVVFKKSIEAVSIGLTTAYLYRTDRFGSLMQ